MSDADVSQSVSPEEDVLTATSPSPLLRLASTRCVERGDLVRASRLLEYILQKSSDDLSERLQDEMSAGHCSYQLRSFDVARSHYAAAISLLPSDPDVSASVAYFCRGKTLYKLRQLDPAIEDLSFSIRLDPECASAYCFRGKAKLKKRLHTDALADFSEALRLEPSSVSALKGCGEVNIRLSNFSVAVERMSEAIRLRGDAISAKVYSRRGYCFRMLKRFKDALDDCNEALRLKPDDPWFFCCRADVYVDLKEFPRAVDDFGRAFELDPRGRFALTALYNRGLSYLRMEDYARAVEDFENGLVSDPACPAVIYSLGKTNLLWGRIPEALAAFDRYDRTVEMMHFKVERLNARVKKRRQQALDALRKQLESSD